MHALFASFVLSLALLLSPGTSQAEFILSGSLNWHISSSRGGETAGVTVLPSIEGGTTPIGLIFYTSKKPIPAQSFHPSKLMQNDSESCFLQYSKEKKTYTNLILPNGDSYVVNGNISVQLGQLRIALSVENNGLPFVSVVHEGDETSVLAFLNNQSVANGSGSRLASWFDASIRNIEEFQVKNGGLQLQGVPFKETRIGLPNQSSQKSPCLNPRIVIVSQSLWTEYLRGRAPNEIKRQVGMIRQGQNPDILSRYTVLNALSSGVVALDGYGKPVLIQEERQGIRESDLLVCTVSDLPA